MERFKLRPYQREVVDKIKERFQAKAPRLCLSLATGAGKTFTFAALSQEMGGKTLILVHRDELLEQTAETFNALGEIVYKIKGGQKKIDLNTRVSVAMVQTINKRPVDYGVFDLVIVDECHRLDFAPVLGKLPDSVKVLGVTATPLTDKVTYFYLCPKCGKRSPLEFDCCTKKVEKWRKKIPLSYYYGELVEGIHIGELIEQNMLVQDNVFISDLSTLDKLSEGQSGEFTKASENEVFNQKASYESVLSNYNKYAKGKRTIIFNSNTKANAALIELFQSEGINARGYDSVNSKGKKRADLIKWFKETPDAVLHNVGVFTTGFDCKEIEVVILNRATTSLALYLQMVGRGGRITDEIYKPLFNVVDLGGNTTRFDTWSSPKDWSKHFYDQEEKRVKASDLAPLVTCVKCEAFIDRGDKVCPVCGAEQTAPERRGVYKIAEPLNKMPPPNGAQIIEYCKRTGADLGKARAILTDYLRDMVVFAGTKPETIKQKSESGELGTRLANIIRPIYFELQRSDLEGNRVRTLRYVIDQAEKKILKVCDY